MKRIIAFSCVFFLIGCVKLTNEHLRERVDEFINESVDVLEHYMDDESEQVFFETDDSIGMRVFELAGTTIKSGEQTLIKNEIDESVSVVLVGIEESTYVGVVVHEENILEQATKITISFLDAQIDDLVLSIGTYDAWVGKLEFELASCGLDKIEIVDANDNILYERVFVPT